MLLFFRNETGLGGNNGLTDFKNIYGYPLHSPSTKLGLYVVSAIGVFLVFLMARAIVTSKTGRVLRAIRDQEGRVLFTGYDASQYKLFVFTLSAVICGLAGALYVPQVGIINPSEFQPANSIEMAIWTAVGGRGTLFGAALGAFIVNGAKSWFTVALPEWWLYILGALFIAVTIFFPRGLVAIITRSRS
jgi:urea transport system permease protein